MKKIITVILSLCLFAILFAGCSTSPAKATNQFSDGIVTATLDKESGVLTFSGNGAVDDTRNWLKLQEKAYVKEVVFEEGITSIGSCEFSSINSYPNLTKVTFKGDINAIGDCAFSDNPNLTTVTFNGSCKSIGSLAFFKCYALADINVPTGCKVDSSALSNTLSEETASTTKSSTDSTENNYPTPEPPISYPSPSK